jgi:Zn-dependent metalloprotease
MVCTCHIVPSDVLDRFAKDLSLPAELRRSLENTMLVDAELRKLREQAARLMQVAGQMVTAAPTAAIATSPTISVFDCNHSQVLPGTQVPDPGDSSDPTTKRVFDQTAAVAEFYRTIFGRDSVDDANMALLSSIHYGTNYNNAFWHGSQMTYGDGDGSVFVDFSGGNDVIGHELTHGVTQHTLQLSYSGDAGGLNESISDCFGSMFRQWQAGQTADQADWLIGKDIVGPLARARGLTCLRDLANPAASHCLSTQPT